MVSGDKEVFSEPEIVEAKVAPRLSIIRKRFHNESESSSKFKIMSGQTVHFAFTEQAKPPV